jgi:glutathionyl-hydroquinone reductase
MQVRNLLECKSESMIICCEHTHIQMTRKDLLRLMSLTCVSCTYISHGLNFHNTPQACTINKLVSPPYYCCCLLWIQIIPPIMSLITSKLICTTHYTSTMIWSTYFSNKPKYSKHATKIVGNMNRGRLK